MFVWSAPAGTGPMPPNVVVAYDKRAPTESLTAYVNRQVDSLRGSLDEFQLEVQQEIVFSGGQAFEVVFTWHTPGALMRQRQVFCALGEQKIASIGCTTSADFFNEAKKYFDPILTSFTIHR